MSSVNPDYLIHSIPFRTGEVAMMRFRVVIALLVASAVVAVAPVMAQAQKKQAQRLSPHETVSTKIDGKRVTLVYGRPYAKKPGTEEVRKIWGGLVPYGQVWRTGADEATLLLTEQPIVIGDLTLAPDCYTLFTYPAADGSAKLIVNKKVGQWGIPYDEKKEAANELGRVDLKKETLDNPVEQFTMAIDRGASGGGVISMMWETTKYSVPFSVKK
jgi:hypothetical protein